MCDSSVQETDTPVLGLSGPFSGSETWELSSSDQLLLADLVERARCAQRAQHFDDFNDHVDNLMFVHAEMKSKSLVTQVGVTFVSEWFDTLTTSEWSEERWEFSNQIPGFWEAYLAVRPEGQVLQGTTHSSESFEFPYSSVSDREVINMIPGVGENNEYDGRTPSAEWQDQVLCLMVNKLPLDLSRQFVDLIEKENRLKGSYEWSRVKYPYVTIFICLSILQGTMVHNLDTDFDKKLFGDVLRIVAAAGEREALNSGGFKDGHCVYQATEGRRAPHFMHDEEAEDDSDFEETLGVQGDAADVPLYREPEEAEDSASDSGTESGDDDVREEDLLMDSADFHRNVEVDLSKLVKPRLRPQAPAFIPRYDPTVSLRSYAALIEDEAITADTLRAKAFPEEIIHRLLTAKTRGTTLNPFGSREKKGFIDPEGRGSSVTAKTHYKFNKGEVAVHWRVPIQHGAPLVKRPTTYSRKSFRKWVAGQASALYDQGDLSRYKTRFVSGNSAAQALFYGSAAGTSQMMDRMLQNAIIYVDDYQWKHSGDPLPMLLNDYFPAEFGGRSLVLCGVTYTTPNQWLTFPFHKSKSIIKNLGVRYLSGDEEVDGKKLQSSIFVHFPVEKVLQGNVPSGPEPPAEKVLQGNVPSGPVPPVDPTSLADAAWKVHVVHHLPEIMPLLESFAGGETQQTILRVGVQLSSFLVSIYYATSWQALVAALGQFISGNDKVCGYFAAAVARLKGQENQGFGDFFSRMTKDTILPLIEVTVGAGLVFIADVLLKPVAALVIPTLLDFSKSFKFSIVKQTGDALANFVIDLVKEGVGRIKSAIETRSFAPLWGKSFDPVRYATDVTSMIQYYPILVSSTKATPGMTQELTRLRSQGLISKDWVTPVSPIDYQDIAVHMIMRGEEMVKYFAKYPKVVTDLNFVISKLKEFIAKLSIAVAKNRARVQPFCVLYYGQAGVGKTNLTDLFKDTVARLYALDRDGDYSWQTGVNFQDGYRQGMWSVTMDDVDQTVAPAAQGRKTHIQEVISIVNNQPYSIEQADVVMKGAVNATPILVQITTNFKDMRLKGFGLCPAAFWRRINFYVEVFVKKEFAHPNGMLDPQKALEATTYDIFDLDVRIVTFNTDEDPLKIAPVRMTLPEFMPMLVKAMKEHLALQEAVLARDSGSDGVCPRCFLPLKSGKWCCRTEIQGMKRLCGPRSAFVWVPFAEDDPDYLLSLAHDYLNERLSWKTSLALRCRSLGRSVAQGCVSAYRTIGNGVQQTIDSTWDLFTSLESLRVAGKRLEVATQALSTLWLYVAVPAAALGTYVVLMSYLKKNILQGREANVAPGWVPSNWVRVDNVAKPGLPANPGPSTFTYEDIVTVAKQAHCAVRGPKYELHGYIVGPSTLVVPSHVAALGEVVSVTHSGRSFSVTISDVTRKLCPSNPELMLLKCSGLPGVAGIMGKIRPAIDTGIQQYDECVFLAPDELYRFPTATLCLYEGRQCIFVEPVTQAGDCGGLYVARHNKSWSIVGMHYCLHNSTLASYSVGALLGSLELKSLASSLATVVGGVVTVQSSMAVGPLQEFDPFGYKSEVWAAQTHPGAQVYAFGHLNPPLPLSSMKSKVTRTVFSSLVEPFEEEVCGVKGYWNPPELRGSMVDNKWASPYTDAFSTQNLKVPDQKLIALAVLDYLQDMHQLDLSGYGMLSEEEVLSGVGPVHSMNLRTSVGPPYNRPKRHYMHIDREEGSFVDPMVLSMYDEGLAALERGEVPAFLGLCTPKDEALKPGKVPRIFICLPAALNMLLKRTGAWQYFMRNNWKFFESAVGINMTSLEATRLVHYLAEIDPSLTAVYEGDARRMDKSWNGEMFDAVALVISCMSRAIGVGAEENYLLVQSLKHTRYSMKNDIFSVTGWNPSGNQATVELNGLFTSLGMRYVYYRTRPFLGDWNQVMEVYASLLETGVVPTIPGLNFREHNRLIHYGDDNLLTTRFPLPASFTDVWKNELGMEMTDAGKAAVMVAKPLAEVSFLKRNFVYDAELLGYKTPLSKMSIARMLLIKKDSILSALDHAAVVCSEVMAEAAYHDKGFFDQMSSLTSAIAASQGITRNPYYRVCTWDEYREKMKLGNFQTWSNRDHVPNQILQSKMSQVSLAKGADVTPPSQEVPLTALETTSFPSTDAVEVKWGGRGKYFQELPGHSLNDFLLRGVPGPLVALNTYDLLLSNTMTFDPWQVLLNDSAVKDKLRNYKLIQGTIQVIGVVAVPGLAYGHYVISALPNAFVAKPATVLSTLEPHNCRQVDFYADVDLASPTDVVFQLPWTWPYDYAQLPGGPLSMWDITITCLSPIRTSVPGGVVTGTIQFYVSLMSDYDVAIPTYQSKEHKIVANAALQRLSPSLHSAIGEGRGSSMARDVAEVAGKLSSVPVIGSMASAVQLGASAAASALSFFGFTRANDENPPSPCTMRSVSNVARFDGPDTGDMAALSIGNSISIDPTLVGAPEDDQLAFESLSQRWTLIKRMTWNVNDTGLIGSIYVSPFFCATRGTAGTPLLTTSGFCGLPFSYWRADMEYQIIIPASSTHRGRLQVYWSPAGSPYLYDPTNLTINTIIDVSNREIVNVKVGYAREVPFLDNTVLPDVIGMTAPDNTYNGTLQFRIVNPLTAQTDTADTTVFVFARATNVQFAAPRDQFSAFNDELATVNISMERGVRILQSKLRSEVFVPDGGMIPGDDLYFGEVVASGRAMMQKPMRLPIQATGEAGVMMPKLGTIPLGTFAPVITWEWCIHYASLFVGLAASERFKIFPSGEVWAGVAPVVNSSLSDPTVVHTLSPMTFCGPNKGAEFTVPYYRPVKFVSVIRDATANRLGLGSANHVQCWAPPAAPNPVQYNLYHSYGPDIRVARFRQVPRVALIATAGGASWWQ